MKHLFRLSSGRAFVLTLILFLNAAIFTQAQTPSATPDSFVAQITSVPSTMRSAFANGISGDGRFVVIESSGDIATLKPGETTRAVDNSDGNREIFLFDYAQRRIFQITNTKSALKDRTKPPVDAATPTNFSNVEVEVNNNRPVISNDGHWIVFSSNAYVDNSSAASPKSFDGSDNIAGLKLDGNQEVFLYRVPDAPGADLSSGAEVPFADLSTGTLTRVTFTTNSTKPRPGTATAAPSSVDDNRSAALNDDSTFVAFVSSRDLSTVNGGTNPDLNPEIYIYNRNTGGFSQVTNTTNPTNSAVGLVWNANPSLSADGTRVAFISSAENLDTRTPEADAARGNGEVYFASFNGAAVSGVTKVTRTPVDRAGGSAVVLSPGARLSRNGNSILFESRAELQNNGATDGALQNSAVIYLYNVSGNTFTRVTPRLSDDQPDISLRFPTFSGDSSTIVFASRLNFRADGQISTSTTEGLNTRRRLQVFSAPVSAPTTFTRLTNTPTDTISGLQAFPSNTTRRLAFSYSGAELGGGNADFSSEVFYALVPDATGETPAPSSGSGPVSYATGASDRPVAAASPAPSADAVTGLAPGMLGIARSTTVNLAPSERNVDKNNTREDQRRPSLPIELSGVSVAFGNVAAGLYFVAPGQINFVVPAGLPAGAYPVVIYNGGGLLVRSSLQVNAAQPDIATTSNGPGGRAVVVNVTNPLVQTAEPFTVTTTRPKADGSGTETVPTELLITLTGIRNVAKSAVTVRIKETDLTGDAIVSVGPSLTAGFDQIVVRLPASLAGAGDVPIIVTVSPGGQTASSRPVNAAPPNVQIN